MRDREKTIEHVMQYCQHYDPGGITMIGGKEPSGHCKAGVVYFDQFPNPNPNKDEPQHYAIFMRVCCTEGNKKTQEEQLARCPKWLRSTREQGEKRADEWDESMRRMRAAAPIIAEFRKKPWGKQKIVDCPACGTGKLHLSQASSNGHVWGRCTTDKCLNWME